jgi:YVTN family beta-propeller protein
MTGTLIVLNKGSNSASFIDVASGDTLTLLPTGRDPHELVVTSDGRWAVGTNSRGGNSLTVFDVQNLAVARTIDLDAHPDPHGLLLMPGEEEVIVTTEGSNEVVIVNFHTGAIVNVIATFQPGSHMVAMAEDGSVAYTANTQGNSVSVIDMKAGRTIRSLDVPQRPEAITTNRSGSEIWVGSNADGVVSVVNPLDGGISEQFGDFSWPYRILLTTDRKYAIMPDARSENLRIFDLEEVREHARIDLAGRGPQGVTLHPDGKTLFLSLSRADRVMVIDIESAQVLAEYATGSGPDGIGYSALTRN